MTYFIHHHDFYPDSQALFLSQSQHTGKVFGASAALKAATLTARNLFNRNNNMVIYCFIAAYISKLTT
ncbi:hypothetical protein ACQE32_11720 [Pantoea sp. FN0302]|uniref:hypothetical protein n=1 Tax=unclassified Pantoea TaxID=2630326 RepID=UPI003CEF35CC